MSRASEAMCLIPGPGRESVIRRIALNSIPEPNTGCILWLGGFNKRGYPRITAFGRSLTVHRVVLLLDGAELPEGVHAAHRCHVKACISTDHIRPLSPSENSKENRGRGFGRRTGWGQDRLGVSNWRAKLTESQVIEIRRLLAEGASRADIIRRFGVTRTTVRNIFTRKTWKHLDEGGAP